MSDDIDYRADELANAVIGMQKMINDQDATIDRLEAENAALREEVENEKRQTAEVERWSGLLLYSFCVSGTIAERAEKELERDRLALSDENARLNEALGEAEAKVEKVRKTINDPMVCEYQQMRNRLIEDLK